MEIKLKYHGILKNVKIWLENDGFIMEIDVAQLLTYFHLKSMDAYELQIMILHGLTFLLQEIEQQTS